MAESSPDVVVVGLAARDLVLRVDALPDAGGAAEVLERRELLGGKGANQAVGLAQLGVPVGLLAVLGADDVGGRLLRQARDDGIDTRAVVRRGETGLLVDVVDGAGRRRLLEHRPPSAMLTEADVEAAAGVLRAADTVCLQLKQSPAALVAAARHAVSGGARVVLDGAVPDRACRDALIPLAAVVRANAAEAEVLAGEPVPDVEAAERVARRLLAAGPEVVALAVADLGDLVVWDGGSRLHPYSDQPVVDRTGAGDAFVAGLVAALRSGAGPATAGEAAAAAAASVVRRLGGRPHLGAS